MVTGPSGAGKGTLIRELLERVPDLEVTVSATTRDRRPGEEDGREYWFLDPDEFLARIEADAFLEHVVYVSGHRYGTLRPELERIRAKGGIPLLELETEGALRVKSEDPGAVTIFISAKRARQINNYHHQLGEGTFDDNPPPLVESRSKNYLTMAMEEISEGMLTYDYVR